MSFTKRPSHTRQASILPPPTQSFLQQIQQTHTVPYTGLPTFSLKTKKEIVLLQSPDARYTFLYRGLMKADSSANDGSGGDYTYQTFVVTDGWMNREWSVYVLDSGSTSGFSSSASSSDEDEYAGKAPSVNGVALKRSGSLSSTSSSGSSTIGGSAGGGKRMVGANEQLSLKNERVRNALTAAFLETISRSWSSTQITI